MMAFLLALAYRGWLGTDNDEVQDDIEDRRIARVIADQEGHFDERDLGDPDGEVPSELESQLRTRRGGR
jgi:multicomponent Na+:H+ antiporter subunit C